MKTAKRSIFALACCLLTLASFGQDALSTYKKAVGENIPYNEGREFPGYGIKLDGHPFFVADQLSDGDIVYDGTLYTGVPMLYDLVADEVVIRPPGSQYLVRLSREKVPTFTFRGEEFFRADPDSTGQRYYQSIYKGGVRVFAQKRKQLNHVTTSERAIDRFEQYDDYFILKDGEITRVSSKNNVLKCFRDQREELRKMIAREQLSFRNDPENFLRRCASVQDQSRTK
jgi:hypothetical protein